MRTVYKHSQAMLRSTFLGVTPNAEITYICLSKRTYDINQTCISLPRNTEMSVNHQIFKTSEK